MRLRHPVGTNHFQFLCHQFRLEGDDGGVVAGGVAGGGGGEDSIGKSNDQRYDEGRIFRLTPAMVQWRCPAVESKIYNGKGADLARHSAGFIFKGTEGKGGTGLPLREILIKKWLEPTGTLALGDVDKLMHHQLPVSPTIEPDDNSMSNRDSAARCRDDETAAGGFRELLVFRDRDSIHDQDPHP